MNFLEDIDAHVLAFFLTLAGPQISQVQYDRIMSHVKSGVDEGATLLTGGKRHGTEGFYIEPVSADLPSLARGAGSFLRDAIER